MSTRAPRQTIGDAIALAFRTVVIGLAVYGGLDLVHGAMAQDDESLYLPSIARAAHVESLDSRAAALESLLANVSRDGNDIYVTGANLHVVNGEGLTGTTNGLGNVVIGYNESREPSEADHRSGSHMLVVGESNNYSGYGGIVVGVLNDTRDGWSAVCGGIGNVASGGGATVSGGTYNVASGTWATVSGGVANEAAGLGSSVSGGVHNSASGQSAWAGGGHDNTGSGDSSSVSGGSWNVANGMVASVSGGWNNAAAGTYSSVSGGATNVATGESASVGGGHRNIAQGMAASVSGGGDRQATADYSWRAGELLQPQ